MSWFDDRILVDPPPRYGDVLLLQDSWIPEAKVVVDMDPAGDGSKWPVAYANGFTILCLKLGYTPLYTRHSAGSIEAERYARKKARR